MSGTPFDLVMSVELIKMRYVPPRFLPQPRGEGPDKISAYHNMPNLFGRTNFKPNSIVLPILAPVSETLYRAD